MHDKELPKYVSHKTVQALEIADIRYEVGDDSQNIHFKEDGYAPVKAEFGMFSRYKPVAGDFYVVYADGYKSFSPRKAFLEGYTKET